MKNEKNRRRSDRWPLTVLVKCAISKDRNDVFESEMWAKDVSESGMKLEWTRDTGAPPSLERRKNPARRRFDDARFGKGSKVTVEELFYDDHGSPALQGKILWARQIPSSQNWCMGVKFVGPLEKKTRAFLKTFNDFINIVRTTPELAR